MYPKYDLVVVGSSFASTFFLHKVLQKAPQDLRILVLERGELDPWTQQMEMGRNSTLRAEETFTNATPWKRWIYTPGLGGSSKCWTGNTPRMMPNDFRMRSTYGIGVDWPLNYETLDPYYVEAEEIMAVSGPDLTPYPRSRTHPLPAHRFSEPDKLLHAADPQHFFSMPCARPTRPVGNRPACCATSHCSLCPINSKFTIENTMAHVYEDNRVTLLTGAEVQDMAVAAGNQVESVRYLQYGIETEARADLVILGANGIFNPYIMLRSGIDHPLLGRNLVEQASKTVRIYLDGVNNFGGSTYVSGLSYRFYDGPHRSEHAGFLIETNNRPKLRIERGRYREYLELRVVMEDLPQLINCVEISDASPKRLSKK